MTSIIRFGHREYDLDVTDGQRGLLNLRILVLGMLDDARAAVNSDTIPHLEVYEALGRPLSTNGSASSSTT